MQVEMKRGELLRYLKTLEPSTLQLGENFTEEKGVISLVFREKILSTGLLPSQIVVADEEVDDFFAWCTVYLTSLSPISSLIEVISRSDFQFNKRSKAPLIGRKKNALLSIAIIEAATQSIRTSSRASSSLLTASTRCLSWVIAQGIINRSDNVQISNAIASWHDVRGILRNVDFPVETEVVTNFWSHILALFESSNSIRTQQPLEAINRLFLDDGEISYVRWSKIAPGLNISSEFDQVMRGPKEQRMRLLEIAVKTLPLGIVGDETYAAFCGYLASRISNGSLELWPSVATLSERYPTMILWFAFYCGAHQSATVLEFDQSILRRLDQVLGDKLYDIDAREMRIMSRSSKRIIADIPQVFPGIIRAKLANGIINYFSTRGSSLVMPAPNQMNLYDNESELALYQSEIRQRIVALKDSSEKALSALAKINESIHMLEGQSFSKRRIPKI